MLVLPAKDPIAFQLWSLREICPRPGEIHLALRCLGKPVVLTTTRSPKADDVPSSVGFLLQKSCYP